jgi:hypothetical protein
MSLPSKTSGRALVVFDAVLQGAWGALSGANKSALVKQYGFPWSPDGKMRKIDPACSANSVLAAVGMVPLRALPALAMPRGRLLSSWSRQALDSGYVGGRFTSVGRIPATAF